MLSESVTEGNTIKDNLEISKLSFDIRSTSCKHVNINVAYNSCNSTYWWRGAGFPVLNMLSK